MGGSYGGYATLCGLAFTPELYACGVDIVGPSSLRTLLQSFPPYWAPRMKRWTSRVGDVLGDDALNRRLSPLFHVDQIRAPLLIGHGANDPRVKISESNQVVEAMRRNGRDVTYVVYPDEGHGFGRDANIEDFNARVEAFLAKHLGGRTEVAYPVEGTSAELR
jgi:dipeptidyl aminopeptidase/acylaminoacyl peptidase